MPELASLSDAVHKYGHHIAAQNLILHAIDGMASLAATVV